MKIKKDRIKRKHIYAITYLLIIIATIIILLLLPRSCSYSGTIYAGVGGCVYDPGVYPMYKGMTLYELIRKADGMKPNADLDRFNPDMIIEPWESYCIPCKVKKDPPVKQIIAEVAPYTPKRELNDVERFTIIYAGLPRTFILLDVYPNYGLISATHIPWFTAVHDLVGNVKTLYEMYLIGGTEALVRSVSDVTQTNIDYYFAQDRPAWIKFIDYLGGVKVDIPVEFAKQYRVNSGIHIIDGYTSWFYITFISKEMRRIDYKTGSMNRITRQKLFMEELYAKFKNLDFFRSSQIGKSILTDAETNLSAAQALELSNKVRKMSSNNLKLFTYPGVIINYNGENYWEVNPIRYKNKIFNEINN